MLHHWHTFHIKRTLNPEQPGTKKFVARHGDRLVCVRYRYDTRQRQTITTVELVVDERRWEPDPQRIPPHKRLSLKVAYGEVEVGKAIKAAGGVWDAQRKVWKLAYKQVVALGLTDRIVADVNRDERD